MEDDKDNQDLVVDNDGSMSQGVNIKVNAEESASSEPVINDIEAPPEPVVEENNVVTESTAPDLSDGVDNSSDVTVESEPESPTSVTEPIIAEPPTSEEPSAGDSFAPLPSVTTVQPDQPQSMSNNEQSQPKEHRNNKKLAVIVTLLIATLLAGVAIYLFMSAEENAEEASTPIQSTQQTQEVTPATAEDIDQAVREIDETVQSIDDNADLNEEAVSDSTLGL